MNGDNKKNKGEPQRAACVIGTDTGRFAVKNPTSKSTPKDSIREGIVEDSRYVFVYTI